MLCVTDVVVVVLFRIHAQAFCLVVSVNWIKIEGQTSLLLTKVSIFYTESVPFFIKNGEICLN